MGKTIVVVIIILLALACGALGWEVMRQQSDKQALISRLDEHDTKFAALTVPAEEQPGGKWATEDMFDDLGLRIQTLEDQNKELLASVEKLSESLEELKKSGVAGASPTIDPSKMSDEQKKDLQKMIRDEAKAQDLQRANMLKGMVMQRVNTELQKVSEQLELRPTQKEDVSNLAKKVVDKGFKAGWEAFEKQEWDKLRENMHQIVEEMDTELKKILDPDQIEKLKELDPQGFGRRDKNREENR
jgi:hypothetical protein